MTPTARTLALLRRCGYRAAVVESWVPRANVRRDLFGFADVLAVAAHRDPRFLLVQCTTAAHVAHRLAKAKGRPGLRTWLAAGGAFEVWGWARRGRRWTVRRVAVQGDDLRDVLLSAAPRRRRHRQPELFS
jgi:hypothetical protein